MRFLVKDVGNSLLQSEISSSQESAEKVSGNFGGPGGMPDFGGEGPGGGFGKALGKGQPQVQAYESIDAVVDMKVLAELMGIQLGLILISSLAAMISIQRFSPLTILKERS